MRPVSGSAARAVHEVGIGDLDALVELARQAAAAQEALARLAAQTATAARGQPARDRAELTRVARSLRELSVRSGRVATRVTADIDTAVRRAAEVSQRRARQKLEAERRKTGRPEQPEAFIGFAGGRAAMFGSRRRLRNQVESGILEASAGSTRVAFQVQVGVLDVLEKATDRQGEPVWMHVEYGQTNGGPQHGKMGAFFAPGQAAPAQGLRRSQAVFVPTKMRPAGGLRTKRPARAYNFLQAGREGALASLRPSLDAARRRAHRELKAIAKAQDDDLAAIRRVAARRVNERRRDSRGKRK
jgi:hypothetical protein